MMNIHIIGISGLAGQETIKLLGERSFPVSSLKVFGFKKSVGTTIHDPKFGSLEILDQSQISADDIKNCDLVFLATPPASSNILVNQYNRINPKCFIIDYSSSFRLHDNIPLVVPEINSNTISSEKRVIANPNCTTIQLVLSIAPLIGQYSIQQIVVTTFQSASGGGKEGIEMLLTQTASYFNQENRPNRPNTETEYAFNNIPEIGSFYDAFTTHEENQIFKESQKILDQFDLPIAVTAVKVPTMYCHCESIYLELENPFKLDQITDSYQSYPGIKFYPDNDMPFQNHLRGSDWVHISRLRNNPYSQRSLSLWSVTDNLRKGSALNAVQIAECILPLF